MDIFDFIVCLDKASTRTLGFSGRSIEAINSKVRPKLSHVGI